MAPSAIVGDWSGRDVPAHFANIEIRFERQGAGIVGTACRYDYPYLSYRDVPVAVEGAQVTFTVHPGSPDARTFVGRFTEDGKTLRGSFAASSSTEIVLQRGGNLCADAHD